MKIKAPAKLNLSLEITGKRPDGYHDISSIFQTVSLFDTVDVQPAEDIYLDSIGFDLPVKENIIYKTAVEMRRKYGVEDGAKIVLEKEIPISAGLGGGSSDAASTIKILNDLWRLNLSLPELSSFGSTIGSDVPFFIEGGTSFVHGRGELIRELPDLNLGWTVIIIPNIEINNKTATMYSYLDKDSYTQGGLSRKLEARIRNGGDCPPQLMFNGFFKTAIERQPGLEKVLGILKEIGIKEIHLTGSGPSLFTVVTGKEVATALSLLLNHKHHIKAFAVENISRVHFEG